MSLLQGKLVVLLVVLLLWCSLISVCVSDETKSAPITISTEFQINLPLEFFADRNTGFAKLFEFLGDVADANPVLEMKLKDDGNVIFMYETHYDTPNGLVDTSNMGFRFRSLSTPFNQTVYANQTYFKFANRLYDYVYAAPLQCNTEKYDCAEKVEQDVHQNFSRYSHETRARPITEIPNPMSIQQLQDIFPAITEFNGFNDSTLQLSPSGPSEYFHRTEKIGLEIGGYEFDTTIDLSYNTSEAMISGDVAPQGAELSFRYFQADLLKMGKNGKVTHVVRRADYFYWLVLSSVWNAERYAGKVDSNSWDGFWGDM